MADSGDGGRAPTNPLMDELRNLMGALGSSAASGVTGRVGSVATRLEDYVAKGGSKAGSAAASGVGKAAAGAAKGVAQGAADTAKQALGGGRGGALPETKVTNIVEEIDVGVPITLAYNQWTQFADFPSFMKKVEGVEQTETERLQWKAQIFWSHRSWESTIIEQIPDERIVWKSEGEKGSVDGAVTFHELAPNLTRIILILEYHPKGVFEHIGNLWRAQGRRVRLELKHFKRHVMAHAILHPEEVEGWRGEIRDGEVVRDHEPAGEEEPAGRTNGDEEEPEPEPERAKPRGRAASSRAAGDGGRARKPRAAPEEERKPRRQPARRTAGTERRGDRTTTQTKRARPGSRRKAAT